MSTLPGAWQPQWSNRDSQAYQQLAGGPEEGHETLDCNTQVMSVESRRAQHFLTRRSVPISISDADSTQPCNTLQTSTSASFSQHEEEKSTIHAESLPPSRLRPSSERNIDLALSLLLLVPPLLLYILAGYAAVLNHRPVDDQEWEQLHYLMTKTVTVYPIIFAVITARAMKKLAAWKLEKGSSLESLEQLMGSLSTGGTLSTIYTLRSYNLLAAGLVAIWALSPIGGQASLFLVHTQREPVSSDINVQYLDTNGNTTFSSGDYNAVLEPLNALFSSLIMSPAWSKNYNYDLWQNLKIPDLLQAGATNSSGWIPISEGPNGIISYASLLGVPYYINSASGNTTFLMQTSYISVACLNVTSGPPIKVIHGTVNSTSATFSNGSALPTDKVPNLSFALDGFDTTQAFPSRALSSSDSSTTLAQDQRTLLVQSRITRGSFPYAAYARAYCPLSTTYLTASVSCIDLDCDVVAIQPSQEPHAPSALIPFAYTGTFGDFAENLATAIPIPDGRADSMSSVVELYIQDPGFIESGTLLVGTSNLASVPIADFSLRLQQVINAYWQGSFDPISTMGIMNTGRVVMNSTTAKNVVWRNVYRCQWGWWAAYIFATTVMLTVAIASLTLDFTLKGPELLGYCSSLVRDSRFFDARYGTGSAIGGAERARMFKTLRLKLVDVGGETGNARLAVVQDGTKEREPLKRGRLYS